MPKSYGGSTNILNKRSSGSLQLSMPITMLDACIHPCLATHWLENSWCCSVLLSSMEKKVKATRSGNARIHGMKWVTMASLAYVAIQVHLGLRFHCYATDHLAAPLRIVIFFSLLQDWHYHGLWTILQEHFGLLGWSRWSRWCLWTAGLVELISMLSVFEFYFQANASIFR